VEFSNLFGDSPLVIGRSAVTVADRSVGALFDGQEAVTVPAGQCRWTDPIDVSTRRGDEVLVDLYLPGTTAHATGNFARTPLEVSVRGGHTGSKVFPSQATPTIRAPDGTEMAIPVPFLRAVEVEGVAADALVACLGDSAAGVTDVVIALGTNDLGLPGSVTPESELPTTEQIIDTYSILIDRATAAGLGVVMATITPFIGSESQDAARNSIRETVNEWIRTSAPAMVDFDAALRSGTTPDQLATSYDSGDHLHPNEQGEARLAQAIADVLRAHLIASKK
jgi:lysophospholipase L1-like esterase